TALKLVHRLLRNNDRAFFHIDDEEDLSELPRPQNISRIRKRHVIADRPGFGIKGAIQRVKVAFLRIHLAVGEKQFEVETFDIGVALRRIRVARNKIGKWPFASSPHRFDRINLRHGCEWSSSWSDQIADLIVGKSNHTINRSDNFRVAD